MFADGDAYDANEALLSPHPHTLSSNNEVGSQSSSEAEFFALLNEKPVFGPIPDGEPLSYNEFYAVLMEMAKRITEKMGE